MPLKPLKKKHVSGVSQNTAENATSSSSGQPGATLLIKQAPPQDKAAEYIKAGNTEALKILLYEQSADAGFVNKCHTKTGKHLLGVAADEGRLESIEILLNSKAEVNLKDQNQMTAVLYATKFGVVEVVKMLVQGGADPYCIYEPTNESVLFFATKQNYIDVTTFFLEVGLPVEVSNSRNESPLSIAIKCEYYDLANLLLAQGANINVRRAGGNTPLFSAVFDNRLTTMKFILDNGGDVSLKNDNGETALLSACRLGFHDIAEFLINQGAELNDVDNAGKTPLIVACIAQKPKIVSLLLDRFANVTLKDKWGYCALSFACKAKPPNLDIIQMLIRFHSPINSMDICYQTPLMHACMRQNMECAEILLKAGADASFKNIDERSARDFIESETTRELFDIQVEAAKQAQPLSHDDTNSTIVRNTSNIGLREKPHWLVHLNKQLK